MKNWFILATPYYHFGMAILAFIVLGLVLHIWLTLKRLVHAGEKFLQKVNNEKTPRQPSPYSDNGGNYPAGGARK